MKGLIDIEDDLSRALSARLDSVNWAREGRA